MKKLLMGAGIFIAALCVNGVAIAGGHVDMKAKYTTLHKAAVVANDKAKKIGFEWRDARDKKAKAVTLKGKDGKKIKTSYLGAAESYAAMGDYKNAIKYAKIAKHQGESAYAQGVSQKSAGPRH